MKCFENKYWVEKLEHELDEDRICGVIGSELQDLN